MLTKVEDRQRRDAFTRFDRLTAYGCAQRGNPYDPAAMHRAWHTWLDLTGPMPDGTHYGDSRDHLLRGD